MPEVTPITPEVTDISARLATIDLPNVKVSGSYAIGKATPKSDIDLLVGIPDAEWGKVTLYTPPDVVNKLYGILPEDKMTIHLYKLSKPNDLWHFQRPRMIEEGKHLPGVFLPVDYSQEMVQGLWDKAKAGVAIPKAEAGMPVTPEVTRVKLPDRMTVGELVDIADPNVPLAKLWKEERPYIEKLMRDIEASGMKRPVTVLVYPDGSKKLWEGHHRLVAAQKLGLKDIPTRFVGPTDAPITEFILERGAIPKAGGNPGFTAKEAKSIGEELGIDFKSYDVEQFRQGLDVELEHCNVTNCDPLLTGKIVQAHLNELPDYYTRLAKMEETGRMKTEAERKSFHERIFGKGSTPPLERLGKGETLNNLLPMPPEEGPPLPRMIALRWPWKK